MKRLKFLTLGVIATTLVPTWLSAGVNDTGIKFEDAPEFLNSRFTVEKDAQLLFTDRDDDATTFSVYDKDMKEVVNFSTPVYPEVSATYTVARAVQGPTNVRPTYTNYNPVEWMGDTQEAFAQACAERGYIKTEETEEGTRYLSENWNDYYYPDILGPSYPRHYFLWSNGTGYECNTDYDCDWGPVGFGVPEEVTQSERPSVLEMNTKSEASCDMDNTTLTQTLFNTDAEYEWIIPVFGKVAVNETSEWEKVEGEQLCSTGLKVMSQNGSTVAEINFPAGYTSDIYPDIYLYLFNEKTYIMVEVKDQEMADYYIVYEVDANSSSLNQIGEPKRVSVYPTTPKRGTPVTVSLGDLSGNAQITVVALNGRTVYGRTVSAGTNSIDINTDRFPQGMYIVNVNDGKTVRQATKIIIR